MNWRRIDISHARNHKVQLYVRQRDRLIEAYHACESLRVCQSAEFVVGSVDGLTLDQMGDPITWTQTWLPDYCARPEMDTRRNEIIPGHEPTVRDLRYGIANMMNQVFDDRSFSKYVKKEIVGRWSGKTSTVEFSMTGEYLIEGDIEDIAASAPRSGRWSVGLNQLVLLDSERRQGARTQIVEIGKGELVFHGRSSYLFQKYKKEK